MTPPSSISVISVVSPKGLQGDAIVAFDRSLDLFEDVHKAKEPRDIFFASGALTSSSPLVILDPMPPIKQYERPANRGTTEHKREHGYSTSECNVMDL